MHLELEKLDFETRKETVLNWGYQVKNNAYPKMTAYQSAYICGLIEKHNPKKIVELGVGGGGTTAIVLRKLESLTGAKREMFSCDILTYLKEILTEDHTYHKVGFLADNERKHLKNTKHTFMLDKCYPEVAETIGDGIDFAILDTLHTIPGVMIDFLAVFPYMKDGGVIVLHDISRCYQGNRNARCVAMNVLFSAVSGDKYINFVNGDTIPYSDYPNIGAVVVNASTKDNIDDIFYSLMHPWNYIPAKEQLKLYGRHFSKFYSKYDIHLFKEAIKMNRNLRNIPFSDRLYAMARGLAKGIG